MLIAPENKIHISARLFEYAVPPVKDLLIMGKNAPIGCIAMRRALELLVKTPYAHIELDDDVISDVLVRQQLLKRLSKETLLRFVVQQVKPLMDAEEVLQVEVDLKVFLSTGM
jgi:hypothetical protein